MKYRFKYVSEFIINILLTDIKELCMPLNSVMNQGLFREKFLNNYELIPICIAPYGVFPVFAESPIG